jgi:murein L,D-transpeptidase YafK
MTLQEIVAGFRRGFGPPGGDIYIHGLPNRWRKFATPHPRHNWTTGCIAAADAEIREQSSLVSTGTRVVIHP